MLQSILLFEIFLTPTLKDFKTLIGYKRFQKAKVNCYTLHTVCSHKRKAETSLKRHHRV